MKGSFPFAYFYLSVYHESITIGTNSCLYFFSHKDALLQAIIPTGVLLLKVLHTMYVVLQNYENLFHQKQLCHTHLKGNAISIILFVSVKERFSNVICVKNDLQHIPFFLIL